MDVKREYLDIPCLDLFDYDGVLIDDLIKYLRYIKKSGCKKVGMSSVDYGCYEFIGWKYVKMTKKEIEELNNNDWSMLNLIPPQKEILQEEMIDDIIKEMIEKNKDE